MERPEVIKAATHHHARLGGRRIAYRVVRSTVARKLRVRVGPNGVEVTQPVARNGAETAAFVNRHGQWILEQLRRVERLQGVLRLEPQGAGKILFRGEPTRVRVEKTLARQRSNMIRIVDGEIVIERGRGSRTPLNRSLENWLRRQARTEIERQLAPLTARLKQRPRCVYVMGQRTKWGNCSAARNLSFNWRLILAPEFVLRYIVTHEAVHLAIPDHSAKFWLTVQGLCRETERAKQWLCRHQTQVTVDLGEVVA